MTAPIEFLRALQQLSEAGQQIVRAYVQELERNILEERCKCAEKLNCAVYLIQNAAIDPSSRTSLMDKVQWLCDQNVFDKVKREMREAEFEA